MTRYSADELHKDLPSKLADVLLEIIESEEAEEGHRLTAAEILKGLPANRRTLGRIRQALEKPLPVRVRAGLIRALAPFCENFHTRGEAVEILQPLIDAPDTDIRLAAIEALRGASRGGWVDA